MVMTIALAALAASAMLMSSGAHLVANYHRPGTRPPLRGRSGAASRHERPHATIRSRCPRRVRPDRQQCAAGRRRTARQSRNVVYDLYAGPTGSASQEQGRFVTVVAVAKDTDATAAIHAPCGAQSGDVRAVRLFLRHRERHLLRFERPLNGPVFSDDVITTCGVPQKADFMDSVWTPQTFVNGDPALDTLYKGWTKVAAPLQLPTTAELAALYPTGRAPGRRNSSRPTSTPTRRQRSCRVSSSTPTTSTAMPTASSPVRASSSSIRWTLRPSRWCPPPSGVWTAAQMDSVAVGYLRSGINRQHDNNNCGEWRYVQDDNGNLEWEFFPIAVHTSAWYKTIVGSAVGGAVPPAISRGQRVEVTVVGAYTRRPTR